MKNAAKGELGTRLWRRFGRTVENRSKKPGRGSAIWEERNTTAAPLHEEKYREPAALKKGLRMKNRSTGSANWLWRRAIGKRMQTKPTAREGNPSACFVEPENGPGRINDEAKHKPHRDSFGTGRKSLARAEINTENHTKM
jgi:hypothetical protein